MSCPPRTWSPPAQVRFGINGKWIAYGHDHHPRKRGLPGKTWFTTDGISGDGRVCLRAPGYGGKPYGSGAVYVNWIDIAIWGKAKEAA